VGLHLWAFIGIAALVIVVPGPDTVLVTKNALLHGRAAALGTAFGVDSGLVIWTVAAAFGVAALVRESAIAFSVLKVAGAAYLIWLGWQALRAARRGSARVAESPGRPLRHVGAAVGFRQGLLCNLANPKIAVFFTSLLAQFVASRGPVLEPFLLLGGLFVAMTVVWLGAYALVAVKISNVLARPSVKTSLERVTGVALIGLGVGLVLERR
jgi:threonine/homoserine/homoserine lactone efflux protein